MQLLDALSILGLTPQSEPEELHLNFRKLVKKYHPDFNHGNERWAHAKMTGLNLAYELAKRYFAGEIYIDTADSAFQADVNFESDIKAEAEQRNTEAGTVSDGSNDSVKDLDNASFSESLELILDGIYTFYQYGLENVHIRKEGVHRFRFRSASQRIRMGIHLLEALEKTIPDNAEQKQYQLLLDFADAFYKVMQIKTIYQPVSGTENIKAYRHYREGSRLLDLTLRARIFSKSSIRPDNSFTDVNVIYREFFIVLSKYPQSLYAKDTVLKLYLLESFLRLTKVIRFSGN